ncbi:hypothetical protein BHM03_00015861, partial [Ensete ventricosum]
SQIRGILLYDDAYITGVHDPWNKLAHSILIGCFHSFISMNTDICFFEQRKSNSLPHDHVAFQSYILMRLMEEPLKGYLLDILDVFLVSKDAIDRGVTVQDTHQVKLAHILHALGPEEPHVASTLSDAVLEKSGSTFWDPEVENAELEGFLNAPLPSHPKLHRGQLKNGLRYIILPNKVPANRYAINTSLMLLVLFMTIRW